MSISLFKYVLAGVVDLVNEQMVFFYHNGRLYWAGDNLG